MMNSIHPDSYNTMTTSIQAMIMALQEAASLTSLEQPGTIGQPSASHLPTGRCGRPRKQIDLQFLEQGSHLRGPKHLAAILGCSARTVRRRLVENGIRAPGEPVFKQVMNEEGVLETMHTPTAPKPSNLSDAQLDEKMRELMETFPNFGRQMILGNLDLHGFQITRQRQRDSYQRIMGTPPAFGRRTIERRVYKVAGPNALWHHDGQHGKWVVRM
jgi:hypothetical protein